MQRGGRNPPPFLHLARSGVVEGRGAIGITSVVLQAVAIALWLVTSVMACRRDGAREDARETVKLV